MHHLWFHDTSPDSKLYVYIGKKSYIHRPDKPDDVVEYPWQFGGATRKPPGTYAQYAIAYVGADKTEADLSGLVHESTTKNKFTFRAGIDATDLDTFMDDKSIADEDGSDWVDTDSEGEEILIYRDADTIVAVNVAANWKGQARLADPLESKMPSPLVYLCYSIITPPRE